ncbi:hypothetical protein K502DRAFT_215524 [Neoconidiobolus thromboides FSU 785]|nr:hypothetical protein K502DRAFT_215524 [Neoconidiobolus thromboides FSU 785]
MKKEMVTKTDADREKLLLTPPYYAVVFSSKRTEGDNGYDAMSAKMGELAEKQDGYLGVESARDESGFGITISYWENLDCIKKWKENAAHSVAQKLGKKQWYTSYKVRITKVERYYEIND